MSTTAVPYSPLNPKFVQAERLIWAANASRLSTTERRGGRVHAEDQGKGNAADRARVAEHMADWTDADRIGFMDYTRATAAIRAAA